MLKQNKIDSIYLKSNFSIVDRFLLLPLIRSTYFILMVFLLYALVYILEKESESQWFFLKLSILESVLLGFFLGLFPERLSRMLRYFCFTLLSIIAIIELFLWYNFHTLLSPAVFQMIIETNTQEASEFMRMFFVNKKFCFLILMSILWLNIYYRLDKTLPLIRIVELFLLNRKRSYKLIITLLIISSITYLFISSKSVIIIRNAFLNETSAYKLGVLKCNYSQNCLYRPIYRLIFSIHSYGLLEYQKEDIIRNNNNVKTFFYNRNSANLVWIIGESCIKKHMSIYGYSKNTTPYQLELFNKGYLYPFNNVITPSNGTGEVFKHIFSMHSIDQKGDWSSSPLFPAVIKKSGYNVYFFTNQFVKAAQNDIFDFFGGAFLNDTEISSQMFTYRNKKKYEYDENLLSDFDTVNKQGEHNFYIFHLIGQHVDYSKRYPKNRQKFKLKDYDYRSDLNSEEKSVVMHYDNATLYNDSVVYQIVKRFENTDAVVIYMSDHGEEVYDNIKRTGRYQGDDLSYEIVENEFCVPFWIYVSQKYIEANKDIVEKIKQSIDNPYMIDNIGHLFLYLSGIRCDDYDSTRVVICDEYNKKRKRILKGNIDYEKIIKTKNK